MKLTAAIPLVLVAVILSSDAFLMPQNPSITSHKVLGPFINFPSIDTAFQGKTGQLLFPSMDHKKPSFVSWAKVSSCRSMTPSPSESDESLEELNLMQPAPRLVILNTRGTIQQYFPGFIQNLQFTQLLNSYNTFNAPTRGSAEVLAAQYNQQARKNTLFNAMTAMANAATAQNQALCNNKKTATVIAIDDFLANVGS